MKEILKEFITNKSKIPVALIGEAGTGKTAIIESLAFELGLPLVKLLTSSMDETDVNGLIIRSPDGAKYISPAWAKILTKNGILFLDEFNCGRKEVVDSLLTLICNKVFPNGDMLGEDVVIIAAMNDAIKYNNYELSPAMKNRFAWINWEMPMSNWLEFVKTKCPNAAALYKEANVIFETKFSPDEMKFATPRSLFNLALFCNDTVEKIKMYAPLFIDAANTKRLQTYNIVDNIQEELNQDIFTVKEMRPQSANVKSNRNRIYEQLSKYAPRNRGGSNGTN